ncbi:zona pellucida sperm-binding protein 3 receptor isoform X3 [Chaetodon auriga]|uniref:zona pellucida sperm-binding protein 3 receptor isoform X3 n=1 Tax=Chaetodon auriga TaxID=39042 RepID=UPI004032EAA5
MFFDLLQAGMEVLLDTCGRRGVRPLLLIYLFVVKATADCPKPQGTGNSVLTNEALLINDFREGSSATLECANGYKKETGSGITTCINGNWTEPDIVCIKKNCGLPKRQPNMSFNTSGGTLFGDVITVFCDKGYQISGSSFKQCYATGWSGRAKCQLVTCATPAKVANGRSSWDSQGVPTYGEIIRYICNEGYALVGKDSIVCSEGGEYDSQPPECKGGRGILTGEDRAATTSVTSTTSFQDMHNGAVDVNKDIGYVPVIVSVICISLVVCILVVFLHKYLLKRKGSYDTREDLKPELLQFQNL